MKPSSRSLRLIGATIVTVLGLLSAVATSPGCGSPTEPGCSEAVEISTFELPDGVVGSPYSAMLVATNGDGSYAWALTEGQLPAGLTLSAQGEISGTPTQSEEQTFTVSVTSDGATDSRELLLRIAAP